MKELALLCACVLALLPACSPCCVKEKVCPVPNSQTMPTADGTTEAQQPLPAPGGCTTCKV